MPSSRVCSAAGAFPQVRVLRPYRIAAPACGQPGRPPRQDGSDQPGADSPFRPASIVNAAIFLFRNSSSGTNSCRSMLARSRGPVASGRSRRTAPEPRQLPTGLPRRTDAPPNAEHRSARKRERARRSAASRTSRSRPISCQEGEDAAWTRAHNRLDSPLWFQSRRCEVGHTRVARVGGREIKEAFLARPREADHDLDGCTRRPRAGAPFLFRSFRRA